MRPGISDPEPIIGKLRLSCLQPHLPLFPLHALGLLILSVLLSAASFPNPLFSWSLWPLGWIALAPLFIVINRARPYQLFVYGFMYGALNYIAINYWLAAYHPLALFIVPVIYGFFGIFALPLLRLSTHSLKIAPWLPQILVWCGLEYLKTLGFLGYPYGIMGYTQFSVLPLVSSAALYGVWGVSFLVVAASVMAAWHWLLPTGERKALQVSLVVWAVLLSAALLFGAISGNAAREHSAKAPRVRIALVQHNMDPWIGGTQAYRKNLAVLKRLSNAALQLNPPPQLLVWSETAFIPAVVYHERYREDPERLELVQDLLAWQKQQHVPLLLGNDHAEKHPGTGERIDFNAALLVQNGLVDSVYKKNRLVPFSENFPFKQVLPAVYKWLEDNRTTFWQPGTSLQVFDAAGVRFSVPICFEDSFGYISREMVLAGAQLLVNISNDSWSFSEPSAMQHLGMAVFRAAETGRSMVRATNGGMTCIIGADGSIGPMLKAFTEAFLVEDVAITETEPTMYMRWGDWLGQLFLLGAIVSLLVASLRLTVRRLTHNMER